MTTIAAHVDDASEAMRSANHATMRGPLAVPDAAVVVGNLAELARRTPQLLDYVIRSVLKADPAACRDDAGQDPARVLDLAHDQLDDARHHVTELADHLARAHNHLGRLGLDLPED